jgi:ABC-type uncharacterized transport system permease subunit
MDFYLTALLQGLCLSAIALGVYLSIKIFNIPDITTDGSYTLGGVVTATMLTHHQSLWVTIPAVLIIGGIAGAATGLIHTKHQCPACRYTGDDGLIFSQPDYSRPFKCAFVEYCFDI